MLICEKWIPANSRGKIENKIHYFNFAWNWCAATELIHWKFTAYVFWPLLFCCVKCRSFTSNLLWITAIEISSIKCCQKVISDVPTFLWYSDGDKASAYLFDNISQQIETGPESRITKHNNNNNHRWNIRAAIFFCILYFPSGFTVVIMPMIHLHLNRII